jgi:hypothetical protein
MQTQVQLNKQFLLQKKDQSFSNTNLGYLLCSLETLYERSIQLKDEENYSYQSKFSYYDATDFKVNKNFEQLKKQAKANFHCFRASYIMYIREHKKPYDFPLNLSEDELKPMISEWSISCNNNETFTDFLDLLERDHKEWLPVEVLPEESQIEQSQTEVCDLPNNTTSNDEDSLSTGENTLSPQKNILKEAKFSPETLFTLIPNICAENERLSETVEKEVINTGDFKSYLNLNQSCSDNSLYRAIKKSKSILGNTNEEIIEGIKVAVANLHNTNELIEADFR